MALTDFYPGTTKAFSVTITLNGVAPNITGDTVTLRLKRTRSDADADAVITKAANVATSGATGVALFSLTPAETQIAERLYVYDIVWVLSGGAEYVLESDTVTVLERVSEA